MYELEQLWTITSGKEDGIHNDLKTNLDVAMIIQVIKVVHLTAKFVMMASEAQEEVSLPLSQITSGSSESAGCDNGIWWLLCREYRKSQNSIALSLRLGPKTCSL